MATVLETTANGELVLPAELLPGEEHPARYRIENIGGKLLVSP